VGCGRRLGCLFFLLLLGVAMWLTRDQWGAYLPRLRHWLPSEGQVPSTDSTSRTVAWRPVTLGGASHAERLILALGDRGAPPYTTVLPADFGAFMLMDVAGHVPPPQDSTEAAVVDHTFALRMSLDIKALGGRTAFGPIGGMLADREPLTLSGTFDVVRPGVAEFHVQELSVHGLPVPTPLIPGLVHKVEIGQHPAGLASDALLLNVPQYVADIRLLSDKVAIYRTMP
jgi:hypothetical protein